MRFGGLRCGKMRRRGFAYILEVDSWRWEDGYEREIWRGEVRISVMRLKRLILDNECGDLDSGLCDQKVLVTHSFDFFSWGVWTWSLG